MNRKIFKILQRTLLRGGDCNLGWSWKKFSLQCPELGLWTIPGETGLDWETHRPAEETGELKLTLTDFDKHQRQLYCTVSSFELLVDRTKEAFSSSTQLVLMCNFSI